MTNNDLVKFFIENGVIIKGTFAGKSGTSYSIETDIRNAFLKYELAKKTAHLLYEYIRPLVCDDISFLGVPETGTLISLYLNDVMHSIKKNDFVPNILRSSPKEYQQSTKSVYTVLPVNKDQPYVLIEDDVVTGNTLCKYLRIAKEAELNIVGVISIFGRDTAKAVDTLCKSYGIPYIEIINVEKI